MAGCGVNDVQHLYTGRRLLIAQLLLLLLLLLWLLSLLLLCNGVALAKEKMHRDTRGFHTVPLWIGNDSFNEFKKDYLFPTFCLGSALGLLRLYFLFSPPRFSIFSLFHMNPKRFVYCPFTLSHTHYISPSHSALSVFT